MFLRKIIYSLLLTLFLLPLTVSAKSYSISETDMSITIDESQWYVFTRDNIYNNSELDELGISYDYMNDIMNNNLMYLDAVLFNEMGDDYRIEFIVRKKKADDVNNLINFSNDEVLELAKELAQKQNATTYEVYQNDYKFAYLKYFDSGYYLLEYYTIVNGYGYTITVQKPSFFTDEEEELITSMIDSIIFDIDWSLTDNQYEKTVFDWKLVFLRAIRGGIIGAITGAVLSLFSKLFNKLKKK